MADVQPPDFSTLNTGLAGGLGLAQTAVGGYFATQAAKEAGKQVKSNTGLILALVGGGAVLLIGGGLVLVLLLKKK